MYMEAFCSDYMHTDARWSVTVCVHTCVRVWRIEDFCSFACVKRSCVSIYNINIS